MSPVGPLKLKRMPEGVRRQLDVAGATAWEALVDAHAEHALLFVTLMEARIPFDEAISRYLSEMDVRDPIASSIRSRVLVALEHEQAERDLATLEEPPSVERENAVGGPGEMVGENGEGLRRFRPDVLMKGIARKVRATEEVEQWVALSIARAEEGIIGVHIDNALTFAATLGPEIPLAEAVEDYIDTMRIAGGRAQAVFQRTMARLADLHLPEGIRAGPPGDGGSRG